MPRGAAALNLVKAWALVAFLTAVLGGLGWLIGGLTTALLFGFCSLLAASGVYRLRRSRAPRDARRAPVRPGRGPAAALLPSTRSPPSCRSARRLSISSTTASRASSPSARARATRRCALGRRAPCASRGGARGRDRARARARPPPRRPPPDLRRALRDDARGGEPRVEDYTNKYKASSRGALFGGEYRRRADGVLLHRGLPHVELNGHILIRCRTSPPCTARAAATLPAGFIPRGCIEDDAARLTTLARLERGPLHSTSEALVLVAFLAPCSAPSSG